MNKTKSSTKNSKTAKLTPFQEEMNKTLNKIKEYKLACEANITSILWSKPELYSEYDGLKVTDFLNNMWRVYFEIGRSIVNDEKKQVLDELTVNLYLEKHPKLKEKYIEYGEYDVIEKAQKFVKLNNIDGYISELHKWNAVAKIGAKGFPVSENLKRFVDMTIEEIYDEYDVFLNHVFINADTDVKSYDISEGLYELIEELNEGTNVGLAYHGMNIINNETMGMLCGHVTLIGALSNVGKSSFFRNTVVSSCIVNEQKIVIIVNEEDHKRWQQELLVWVANTIYKSDLQKFVINKGGFTEEQKIVLKKSADWITEKAHSQMITIIPLESYSSEKVIKIIKKYSGLGVSYFCIDTLKADSGDKSDKVWLAMQQSMVDIYNTVKPSCKNVHLTATCQLGKTASKARYYTQDNLGMAKNIIDPVSCALFIRNIMDDEYDGEKNALKVFRFGGKNGKSKIPVTLERDKHYQIVFIVKNRFGSANKFQVVIEHDLSRNTIQEIGITSIMPDF